MRIAGHEREGLLVLPLPWRSAELLQHDPVDVFARAASLLPEPARGALQKFTQRAPEDRSLAAMGYEEAVDPDGFRYRRTW
jgi:hypothetical protein